MYQDAGLSEETFNRINNDECLTAWDKYILFSDYAFTCQSFVNRVLSDFIKDSVEHPFTEAQEARIREIVREETDAKSMYKDLVDRLKTLERVKGADNGSDF